MRMAVMHVWRVLVGVLDPGMGISMRVLSENRRIVRVIVMTVVVTVRVLVLDGLVHVGVPMAFRHVQVHPEAKPCRRDRGRGRGISVAEQPRRARPDEWCEREHGARPRSADAPLCEQVQAQADAVPGGTRCDEDCECGELRHLLTASRSRSSP